MELKEMQRQEAVRRLGMLDYYPKAIREFKKGVLNKSIGYGLYWLNEKEKEIVKDFEERTGGLVYALILNKLEFGTCLSLLYVGKDTDEWELDREDIADGYAFAWTENLDAPDCSEFGTIGVRPMFGGILRTA